MNELSSIHIDITSHGDGMYDAYIDTENCSGTNHKSVSARDIGIIIADLVDTLDEAACGKNFLKQHYELIKTDGYSINRTVYDTKELARAALKDDYTQSNHNDPGDDWDELSYWTEDEALLYDRGENVYVWSVKEYGDL